jgi:hypothetical protein
MEHSPKPLVVQYLYVHQLGEAFYYPTARSDTSAGRVAVRYLECALTQAASLRLQEAPCELVLATNVGDRQALGREGVELLRAMEELGVQIVATEYRHRPSAGTEMYVSSRYVLDAILVASDGQPHDRQLWLTDLDCVWVDPQAVFARAPASSQIGCVYIGYPPDWDGVGADVHGNTRRKIGEIAAGMGGPGELPPWVGGELLSGTAESLRSLVSACEDLDETMSAEDQLMPTEEQILTLAGATGRVSFRDLSDVARRMPTGPRTHAAAVENPLSIGLWHLPGEKGLSLRRAARDVIGGRSEQLRRDFADPALTARRFNVAGTGLLRRIQDDGWIVKQRVNGAIRAALSSR